jgi:hypothetical protein
MASTNSVVTYLLAGDYLTPKETWSEYFVTTDGQSASLSWNKAPIWGLRPDFYYFQTVACLLLWGALERTDLSFTIAAGLARAVIVGSESHGTRDHILLSQIRDFPFRFLTRRAGLRWKYSSSLPHGLLNTFYTCPAYKTSARTAQETPVQATLPLLRHIAVARIASRTPLPS